MKLKVVHIITGLGDGGAEAVMTRLCSSCLSFEHSVISLQDNGKYGKVLQEEGINVKTLNIGSSFKSYLNILKLPILIRQENADVVQTWMYHADLLGGLAAKLVGVKKICWGVRHSSLDRKSTKQVTKMIAYVCAILSKWIPHVIICCADKALKAHAEIGYQRSKLKVIKNGYDLTRFYPDSNSRVLTRESLGIEENDFVVGNVSRFDPNKDHQNLLKALSILKKADLGFKCLLVGRNIKNENLELKKLLVTLELEDRVMLLGQRDDIPTIMNALDVHILSSRSEGFPNVVAEAMACGIVCVSTDVGDARDIVDLPEDSICAARNPDALANTVFNVFKQWKEGGATWSRRKRLCSVKIRNQFNLSSMVDLYEKSWR